MLVFAVAAAAAAVATAQNGGSHRTTAAKPAKTMPTMPKTQPGPPPVRQQTVPTKTPRPLGNVPAINDAKDRRELDAFIAVRPALAPWRDLIWYSAHYSYSNVSARGLAGMIWCIDFRVAACSRAEDARAMRLLGGG